ncbi:hypothetical protein AAMO2058_000277100 [Amorphochlora amoebiformis]
MASGVGPISYKRVMVLGAKRTGKSSLLGAALNGDMGEGQMYNPTLRVERFYDVDRKLQFIDTPGLDSQILLGDLLEFNKDPVVKEFLDEVEYEKKEILKDVQIPAISAFVIVFCADEVTERMAEALYNAISLKNDKADGARLTRLAPIFMVYNQFWQKSGVVKKKGKMGSKKPESKENKVKKTAETGKSEEEMKESEYKKQYGSQRFMTVNVKTFKNLDDLLDRIANTLNSRREVHDCLPQNSTREKFARETKRESCNSGCSIS